MQACFVGMVSLTRISHPNICRRFGFHGTLWFYSGISILALLYGFYFMPDYTRCIPTAPPSSPSPSPSCSPSASPSVSPYLSVPTYFSVSLARIEKEALEKQRGKTTHQSLPMLFSWASQSPSRSRQPWWAGRKATGNDEERVAETKACWPGQPPFPISHLCLPSLAITLIYHQLIVTVWPCLRMIQQMMDKKKLTSDDLEGWVRKKNEGRMNVLTIYNLIRWQHQWPC